MSGKADESYELTHPQKRIWYMDRIHAGSWLHNIGGSLDVKGRIHIETMRKTINRVIKTNEGMRLQFRERDGKPMQSIAEFEEQPINFFDFSNALNPEVDYQKWVDSVFRESFDLEKGCLFYFAIYKVRPDKYGVLLKMHHLIADGWSISLIQQQICEGYTQLIQGQEREIADCKNNSYTQFIEDEKKYLSSKRCMRNKAFWAEKLKNPPSECLYNTTGSIEGMRSRIEIENRLSLQIKQFTDHQKCSLNTFFIAAVMIYQYKVTNQKDIIIGTSVFNRTNRTQRGTVGMFTSTMPFRLSVDPEQTVGDFINQVKGEVVSCLFNQKYPYDLMIQDLALSPSGYDSLFRMTVNYYKMDMDKQLGDQVVTVNEHYNGHQSDALQLIVKEWVEPKIVLEFDYKRQEYEEIEIKTMQAAIIRIAQQLMDKDLVIKDVCLVSEDERDDRLYDFNATQASVPSKTVAELFEEQVARVPHRRALEFKGDGLTYEELNAKANQLAGYLLEKGVNPQTTVSVLQTHSPELVMSLLGILKAGGSYLPMDPDDPIGRINDLLKDSRSKLLLTNVEREGLVFDGEMIQIKDIDLRSYCTQNLVRPKQMGDLAYLIYTSGSTGRPKGVMIKHQGLTNYIWWAAQTYFKDEEEAMALYSSIGFDLTVTSVFAPLVLGHKVVVYEQDEHEFVLYQILRDDQVTVIKLTPAHLALLKGRHERHSTVKRLIVGGDDLKVSLVKEVHEVFGGIEIYNEYGPTETVVGSMIHPYDEARDTGISVPIGSPINNTQVYILDADLKVMPVGIPGEIYIAGAGIAKGYLNNDALTQEKFVNNPFVRGQKMYKTGDMGRYLENGVINYMGRADHQVKIRGHRVELGEIERCLTDITGVDHAMAVCKDSLGNHVVHVYIIAPGVSEQTLKNKLSETLPRYMMPTHFVFMDQFPLTLNGKVDVSSLPEPEVKESEFAAALTRIEKALIQVMSDVLGVTHISMNDHFYQLGGDSVKAIQISSRLANRGYALKAKDILSSETLKETAAAIEKADSQSVVYQGMATGCFELTPIMKWFFQQKFVNENHYHQSIRLKMDHLEMSSIKSALLKLVLHHDALRLNYDRAGKNMVYNNQISEIVMDYLDLSAYSSEEQDLLVEEYAVKLKSGLDIEKDLLFKAGAFNLGRRGYLLLLTAHHLVVDGVSWRIILEDLDYLLSVTHDQVEQLPLKTHAFKEWSHWLSTYSQNSFDVEKRYWSEALSHGFKYPFDLNTGPDTVDQSMTLRVELEAEKTKPLSTVVKEIYGLGIHETLIIALAATMKDLTGQNELIIELEGHGREEMESGINISRTVGWFTSLYPIRLNMQDEDLDANIKSLKEQIRSVPNKGFDFGILRYLKDEFSEQDHRYVRFNYLGHDESRMKHKSFEFIPVGDGLDTDPHNPLTAILDLTAIIVDDKLSLAVQFSQNKFLEANMRHFLRVYKDRISEIIELSHLAPDKQFTPSDFSASGLSQDDLDRLWG